jgi:hypothetical protein
MVVFRPLRAGDLSRVLDIELVASGQIRQGDFIEIDYGPHCPALTFSRQDEGLASRDMARFAEATAMAQTAFAGAV